MWAVTCLVHVAMTCRHSFATAWQISGMKREVGFDPLGPEGPSRHEHRNRNMLHHSVCWKHLCNANAKSAWSECFIWFLLKSYSQIFLPVSQRVSGTTQQMFKHPKNEIFSFLPIFGRDDRSWDVWVTEYNHSLSKFEKDASKNECSIQVFFFFFPGFMYLTF